MNKIDVPNEVMSGDLLVIASVSGGKDSTALMLALKEAEVPFRAVFADTGWEAPETYAYIDALRECVGPIDVVSANLDEWEVDEPTARMGPMLTIATSKAGFPQRKGRWCTEQLKMIPLRGFHDRVAAETGRETVNVVGVRAEESAERARMPVWEDNDDPWGGWIWRPIREWSVADVIAIHHRHSVPLNPLYLRGHDRVGCFPCINAGKNEIRLVAEHAPWRIDEIRHHEAAQSAERARRNASGEGNFKHLKSTYFSAREALGPKGIDEVVVWSRTERGGKVLPLLQPAPDGGCFRWGMCEPPEKVKP